jgi:hypothetical protein
MRFRGFALFVVFLGALTLPIAAARADSVSTRTWTDESGAVWTETTTIETGPERAARLVGVAARTAARGISRFGPFVVLNADHAALVDATDAASPARFAAMLQAYPAIRVLEMADCPGTYDDTANLRLGRMIRAHAIATEIPAGGSVRSGAVDLFLAGATRRAAPDADFGVHAWLDDTGRGPADFSANDPVNRAYLDYYRAMGMAPGTATAFYALTNSAPSSGVRWLKTSDIGRYIAVN